MQCQCRDWRYHWDSCSSNQAGTRVCLGPVGQAQHLRVHRWKPAFWLHNVHLAWAHCHWRKRSCTPAVMPRSGADTHTRGVITTHPCCPSPGSLNTTFLSPWTLIRSIQSLHYFPGCITLFLRGGVQTWFLFPFFLVPWKFLWKS